MTQGRVKGIVEEARVETRIMYGWATLARLANDVDLESGTAPTPAEDVLFLCATLRRRA